jgi:basic membrane protein A
MDDMARGLERCATDFGFKTKKIESIETAAHEDDIRAVAGEGYDLIFTTFPQMTPATSAVAAEFPDTKFGAVYQFINIDGKSVPNIWDSEYRGDSSYYIAGAMSAKLSKSHRIGFVLGGEDPTLNASLNAWIKGAKSVDPSTRTEFAFANSFEDPAKGKEIALAMASRGVDVVTTAAAKTQLGVLDAAKEKGMLFIGDVADNSKQDPKGFVGYVGSSFGQNIYLGCKGLHDNAFEGGKHTFLDLTNGGYTVPYDVIQKWGEQAGRKADAAALVTLAKGLEAKAKDGSLDIPHDTKVPKS